MHELLRHTSETGRGQAELPEAELVRESIGLSIVRRLGLDTSGYSMSHLRPAGTSIRGLLSLLFRRAAVREAAVNWGG